MKYYIIIATILIMSGCGVYKPYSRPNITIEERYRNAETTDTTTLATLSWRELFTDAHLQSLIELGLKQNTDLNIARLRVEAAEAVLKTTRLAYAPSLGLTAEGGINRYDGATSKTYNVGASVSWELDIFGRLTNAKREATSALQESCAYRQAVQTQLVATIADTYYTLARLDMRLQIERNTLDCWRNTVQTLEALKRAGKSNEAGVLQAKANVMQLESSLLTVEKNINETENALSALLALPSQTFQRNSLNQISFPDTLATGIPLQLLSNRPDVRQAEYALAGAFYATNAARSAFYPTLTLSGTLGWTNNGGGVVVNPAQWLANAIGTLVQPLFNRGAIRANLKIAKTKQEEALLRFQQSLYDAGKEVNNALVAYQTAQTQIEIESRRIATLREAVEKTELLMRHSSVTYLEVLTARQALLSAETEQLQYRFDEVQSVINIYHALGGGE